MTWTPGPRWADVSETVAVSQGVNRHQQQDNIVSAIWLFYFPSYFAARLLVSCSRRNHTWRAGLPSACSASRSGHSAAGSAICGAKTELAVWGVRNRWRRWLTSGHWRGGMCKALDEVARGRRDVRWTGSALGNHGAAWARTVTGERSRPDPEPTYHPGLIRSFVFYFYFLLSFWNAFLESIQLRCQASKLRKAVILLCQSLMRRTKVILHAPAFVSVLVSCFSVEWVMQCPHNKDQMHTIIICLCSWESLRRILCWLLNMNSSERIAPIQ